MYEVIGQRVTRIDALEKVCGRVRYAGDVQLPGLIYVKMLRSPYAHAKVVRVNTKEAEKLPGVAAVISYNNVPRISHAAEEPPAGELLPKDQFIFDNKVRFVGEGVAAVAASSLQLAEKALDLIRVEYEQLPAVFDAEEAMKEGSPIIHGGTNNLTIPPMVMEFGDIGAGFAQADYVFENRFVTSRPTAAFIEPYVCTCYLDAEEVLNIWSSTQSIFSLRASLSKVLGMPESRVRVQVEAVGGAFGAKIDSFQMEFICALLALRTRKPVRLEYSREECFVAGRSRHPVIIYLKQGVRKDGSITARHIKYIASTGAYSSHGPGITGVGMASMMAPYKCPNQRSEGYVVYTNNPVAGAMRGYGNPQAHFALESQMDMIAERLGVNPLEIREKNSIKVNEPGLFGIPLTSTGLSECMGKVSERADWGNPSLRAQNRKGSSKRRGTGIAAMIHLSGAWPILKEQSNAIIKLNPDGTVELILGTVDLGTGSRTGLAQIAAETLGVPFNSVHVSRADTQYSPFENGTYGSRSIYVMGGAVVKAANAAKNQLLELASRIMQVPVERLAVSKGWVFSTHEPDNRLTVAEVCAKGLCTFPATSILGVGLHEPHQAPAFGVIFTEVEVDVDTGSLDILRVLAAYDVGRAINPTLVEGQIEGGIIQGLGYALFENMIVDDKGRLTNDNFTDYLMPTILDAPLMESIIVESIDPTGPFGAKGIGEAGIIAVAPAVANAVYQATGIRFTELPITPEMLLQAWRHKEGLA